MNSRNSLPSLNALRAFDAAGRHLSFTLAAEELGVTLSAVAQHIRALEAELGMKLFHRQARSLTLTEAGRSYASSVERAFGLLVAATRALRPEPLHLSISVTPTFAGKYLIPRLADFTRCHPHIDLRIVATERLSHFKSDAVDLVVRYGRPPFGPGVNSELLFEEVLIAVASEKLAGVEALAQGKKTLENYPLLHDAHNLWPLFFEQGLNLLPVTSAKNMRFNQTALAIDAATAGQGIALAQSQFVAQDIADGRLMQVHACELRTSKGFYIVWPRKTPHPEASAAVRDWLSTLPPKAERDSSPE